MTVLVAVLGLVAGSFITAWSWRLHSGDSMWRSRSKCDACSHKLSPFDLIPVVSWGLNRGKCRYCKQPISKRYPIIELITAAVFLASYAQLPANTNLDIGALVVWLGVAVGLLTIAVYDYEWMLIPMQAVYFTAVLTLVRLGILVSQGESITSYLLAASASGLFFYLLYAISKERWMGSGDVYLVVLMGLLLGLPKTLLALLIAFNSAALISLILIITRLRSRKDMVPFGPFLLGATIIAALYGQPVIDWYLDLLLG